jgi:hypothetical protein
MSLQNILDEFDKDFNSLADLVNTFGYSGTKKTVS